jgi:hypothetical protein
LKDKLEGQNWDLQKTGKNSEGSAVTASNRRQDLKKGGETVVKRVAKLQGRGGARVTLGWRWW